MSDEIPPVSTQHFRWQAVADGDDNPGPRSRHELVHDELRETTILFGGIRWSRHQLLGDTWELRNEHWSQIDVNTAPSPRHRGAMVYDSVRHCSVLFGGQDDEHRLLNDTWTYRDRSWTQWKSWFGRRPSQRCGHVMAFAEDLGVTILFGGIGEGDRPLGDTWIFDGKTWRRLACAGPTRRRYAAFAYHPGLKGCVLHGGAHDDRGRKQYGDAWLFRNGVWSALPDRFTTNVRDDHALSFHRAGGALLMFGGLGSHPGLLALSNDGWKVMDVSSMPSPYQCSPVAYDETLGGLVLHGGETHHMGRNFDQTLVLRLADRW